MRGRRTVFAGTSGGGAVSSVNGQTGVVVLDAEDLGAPLPGHPAPYRGVWAAGDYLRGDCVRRDSGDRTFQFLYQALVDHPASDPVDNIAADWVLLATGGNGDDVVYLQSETEDPTASGGVQSAQSVSFDPSTIDGGAYQVALDPRIVDLGINFGDSIATIQQNLDTLWAAGLPALVTTGTPSLIEVSGTDWSDVTFTWAELGLRAQIAITNNVLTGPDAPYDYLLSGDVGAEPGVPAPTGSIFHGTTTDTISAHARWRAEEPGDSHHPPRWRREALALFLELTDRTDARFRLLYAALWANSTVQNAMDDGDLLVIGDPAQYTAAVASLNPDAPLTGYGDGRVRAFINVGTGLWYDISGKASIRPFHLSDVVYLPIEHNDSADDRLDLIGMTLDPDTGLLAFTLTQGTPGGGVPTPMDGSTGRIATVRILGTDNGPSDPSTGAGYSIDHDYRVQLNTILDPTGTDWTEVALTVLIDSAANGLSIDRGRYLTREGAGTGDVYADETLIKHGGNGIATASVYVTNDAPGAGQAMADITVTRTAGGGGGQHGTTTHADRYVTNSGTADSSDASAQDAVVRSDGGTGQAYTGQTVTRQDGGAGAAWNVSQATRSGAGNGNATWSGYAYKQDTGEGNAFAGTGAEHDGADDSGTGYAQNTHETSHQVGGSTSVEQRASATERHVAVAVDGADVVRYDSGTGLFVLGGEGGGLLPADRPAIATQAVVVDVDAFNALRTALIKLGAILDGD